MSNQFCTVEEVRSQIRTEDSYAGDDALIKISIVQATAMIRQFTRREWTEAEYTDYLDTADIDTAIRRGRGVYIAQLRERPVNTSEVKYPKIRYSASGQWDDVADIPRTGYTVDARKNQLVIYPGVMSYRPRSLRVVYWAGYPISDDDPDVVNVSHNLRTACIMQAAYMVRRELNSTAGTSREGGESRTRGYWVTNNGFIREVLALLRSDTRIFVGGNT